MASREIITHGGSDRSYKICRCGKCGVTHSCTPAFDFYTLDGDPDGKLYCEKCMILLAYHKQEQN